MNIDAGMPVRQSASARLSVLACPVALCPHLEFAVAAVLGAPTSLRWVDQPACAGSLTAVIELSGPPGLAGRLATRLRSLGPVRFEVVEDTGPGADGERYSFSPDLGLYRATLASNGDVVVTENRLRELLAASTGSADGFVALADGLARLLGGAWDEDLEPLRRGGDGAPVSWLRRTG